MDRHEAAPDITSHIYGFIKSHPDIVLSNYSHMLRVSAAKQTITVPLSEFGIGVPDDKPTYVELPLEKFISSAQQGLGLESPRYMKMITSTEEEYKEVSKHHFSIQTPVARIGRGNFRRAYLEALAITAQTSPNPDVASETAIGLAWENLAVYQKTYSRRRLEVTRQTKTREVKTEHIPTLVAIHLVEPFYNPTEQNNSQIKEEERQRAIDGMNLRWWIDHLLFYGAAQPSNARFKLHYITFENLKITPSQFRYTDHTVTQYAPEEYGRGLEYVMKAIRENYRQPNTLISVFHHSDFENSALVGLDVQEQIAELITAGAQYTYIEAQDEEWGLPITTDLYASLEEKTSRPGYKGKLSVAPLIVNPRVMHDVLKNRFKQSTKTK